METMLDLIGDTPLMRLPALEPPGGAQIWAKLEPDLLGRAERSRALNLDPGQVILDTFLRIDAAAERALLPAA